MSWDGMPTRKRPNGAGTIETLPDGRARIRCVIDGKRRQVGPIYPSRDAAELALAAHLELASEGTVVAPGVLTLAALGEEWLTGRELHGSADREEIKSVAGEWSVWRRHVATSDLASMPIETIRPRDVEAFVRWLRGRKAVHAMRTKDGPKITETDKPISRAMQREALRLVRQCLDEAIRREVIGANPASLAKIGKGGRTADLGDDWLRASEIDRLLACGALSLRDRTAYACAIGLSLRSNDLKAIEVAHVHLNAEVPGPHALVWIAKSAKWHRVPILPWLRPWIEAHLAALPKGARWLFPADDRGQVRYRKHYTFNWPEKLDKGRGERRASALEIAGVDRRIRFHDLRGTCATHLAIGTWGRTWSLHEIQRMLAHSDQRVTERYVRRALDMLAAAAAATPGGPGLPMVAHAAPRPTASNANDSADSGSVDRTHDQSVNSPTRAATIPDTCAASGQPMGNRALAEAILAVARASDEIPIALADALVEAVLADAPRAVRLALAAREGGPFEARRLIELAETVLAETVGEMAHNRRTKR